MGGEDSSSRSEYFNPRSPCGERPAEPDLAWHRCNFNPRSQCGERQMELLQTRHHPYFNPRSPCGERPDYRRNRKRTRRFQSTLPVRGATARADSCGRSWIFQSTLPVRGATLQYPSDFGCCSHFNPRSPCGERRLEGLEPSTYGVISIHAPRAGSDFLSPTE